MKIYMAVICIFICTAYGIHKSLMLKTRTENLSEIILFLEQTSVLIKYKALPLMNLIEECVKSGNKFAEKLLVKERFEWEGEINKLFISQREKHTVISSLKELGATDIDGQIKLLESSIVTLKKCKEDSLKEEETKGKMYKSIGFFIGLGLAIMVI